MEVLIAGCGAMAVEYCRILRFIGLNPLVIGRSEENASKFSKLTGIDPVRGGIQNFCKNNTHIPSTAIIAVGVEQLFSVSRTLIEAGCRRLLIEKPGGATYNEIKELNEVCARYNATVSIAYNRRYYPSVRESLRIIEEDGGIESFHFEFTEWAHRIEPLEIPEIVKNNWFLANSTHVIDLAFYLGGEPVSMDSYTSGELSWHKPSNFAGAGISSSGALFTYKANWNAPGRWGLELLTSQRRLILMPLEELSVIRKGSVNAENIVLSTTPEESPFKPGLYHQTTGFLNGDHILPTLAHHAGNTMQFLRRINEGRITV